MIAVEISSEDRTTGLSGPIAAGAALRKERARRVGKVSAAVVPEDRDGERSPPVAGGWPTSAGDHIQIAVSIEIDQLIVVTVTLVWSKPAPF